MSEVLKNKNDKYIPYYFVLFFLVVAAVNAVFVYKALTTHQGVIVENAYEKGLEYNDSIAAYEAQKQLGWNANISHKNGAVIFTLSDETGEAISGADARAYFKRPTVKGMDFDVALTQIAPGKYSADIASVNQGLWKVTVSTKWQDKQFQKSERLVIQ